MSQFNIRNIREISNDPTTKFANRLAKKVAESINKQQQEKLEGKEDIYSNGQLVSSVIKYHSLNMTKKFTFALPFYPPTEPDLDKNTIWIQGRNLGNSTRDLSCFNNTIQISGDPILVDGSPFDYGIHSGTTKSIALRFNRVSGSGVNHEEEYREHIAITDNTRLKLNGSTNMSWFFRVRPLSTGLDQGKRRTIYCKIDDTSVTNSIADIDDAIRLSIDPTNKRLVIQIKRSGTFQSKETAINKFVENNVYDIFVTYTQSGGAINLYLAKVGDGTMTNETLSNSGYTEEWGPDLSSPNARLLKRGPSSDDGAFHGDFYDFKIYRNYLISSTDANRHWTNKWTIADIPFGQVMIADYYSTYIEAVVPGASFTSQSFSSQSFTQ
jgi:flagellar motor protein MotB